MHTVILNAEGHDMSTVLGNSLVIFISFILLLFIIKKFAAGPILSMLENREQHINKQLDDTQNALDSAKEQEKAAKETVKAAQVKANDILVAAKETALKNKEDALVQTHTEIEEFKASARAAIEQERVQVMAQLQSQVGEMSVALAEKIIKRELTPADHQRLIDDFIEGLDK